MSEPHGQSMSRLDPELVDALPRLPFIFLWFRHVHFRPSATALRLLSHLGHTARLWIAQRLWSKSHYRAALRVILKLRRHATGRQVHDDHITATLNDASLRSAPFCCLDSIRNAISIGYVDLFCGHLSFTVRLSTDPLNHFDFAFNSTLIPWHQLRSVVHTITLQLALNCRGAAREAASPFGRD